MGIPVRAQRGLVLRCKGWRQEALLRMLENTLENGERPEDLIIYGASGKAARNWPAYHAIVECLKELEEDETLLIQSGKPVAIFSTHRDAPRVVAANTNLVPAWANWETFRRLEALGLIMYGQYTAGTWAYIGTQGILQGTFETLAECALQHFEGTLRGRLVLTAGLGGMGGAQPLAVTMNGGVAIVAEVDRQRIARRIESGYCERVTDSLDEALRWADEALKAGKPRSIALHMNAADAFPAILAKGIVPDVVTDQTSAHDPLNGYIPRGYTVQEAAEFRRRDPDGYIAAARESIARHLEAMIAFHKRGSVVFEYGNAIRQEGAKAGVKDANAFQGFVPLFIRPQFCIGRGPVRWVALSGEVRDIDRIDRAILNMFPDHGPLTRWLELAQRYVKHQGLPARTCWLGYGQRAQVAALVNDMIARGELAAPVAFSRDHLDSGSVAQPTRETEGMLDGSDAIADWPILNALINTAAGADLVTVHQGAGSGMGGSISAGMIAVADGSRDAAIRLERVMTTDPGIGVIRHADAGYPSARELVRRAGLRMPMLDAEGGDKPAG